MPGPLAAQLAMWLGYLERGALGALVVALPFIVPPFLIVTAVAALYAHYQGLSQVQSVFFGVGPAVMAIIAIAAYKLARSTNKRDPVLWVIAAVVCAATAISRSGDRLAVPRRRRLRRRLLRRRHPAARAMRRLLLPLPLASVRASPGSARGGTARHDGRLLRQGERVHFGSGLAVVPFLHAGTRQRHTTG